jgi:hypothetical protein
LPSLVIAINQHRVAPHHSRVYRAPLAEPPPPKVGLSASGAPKRSWTLNIITQLRAEVIRSHPSYDSADGGREHLRVIDSAVDESLDAIGEALEQNGKVIVTGCLGARPGEDSRSASASAESHQSGTMKM